MNQILKRKANVWCKGIADKTGLFVSYNDHDHFVFNHESFSKPISFFLKPNIYKFDNITNNLINYNWTGGFVEQVEYIKKTLKELTK